MRNLEGWRKDLEQQIKPATEADGSRSTSMSRLRRAFQKSHGCLFLFFTNVAPILGTGIISLFLLNRLMNKRVGVFHLEQLTRGLEGNVTTTMDLALGDVSDLARQDLTYTAWVRRQSGNVPAQVTLDQVPCENSFREAMQNFLDIYGCRANSEIDMSRQRWKDNISSLLQVVNGRLSVPEGEHRLHFKQVRCAAEASCAEIIASAPFLLRPLVRRLVGNVRACLPLREHHKFVLIKAVTMVRQVVLELGADLSKEGLLESADDVWFLSYEELEQVSSMSQASLRLLIEQRKEEFETFTKLRVPRVLTSDGEEVVAPSKAAANALFGTAASAGVVEGVARLVLNPQTSKLQKGEILVAPFTDPGWTPLFINAAGLVMEVGGMMTHGSVIAREYGIPAVVSVDNALTTIRDGQRLRVNGDEGFVELLS